jgi:hypothetical protein
MEKCSSLATRFRSGSEQAARLQNRVRSGLAFPAGGGTCATRRQLSARLDYAVGFGLGPLQNSTGGKTERWRDLLMLRSLPITGAAAMLQASSLCAETFVVGKESGPRTPTQAPQPHRLRLGACTEGQ